MRLSDEGRIWFFAIAASAVIHGACFALIPTARLTAPEPVMDVRLVMAERKSQLSLHVKDSAPQSAHAKPEAASNRVEPQKKSHVKKTPPAPASALKTNPAAWDSSLNKHADAPGDGSLTSPADAGAGNGAAQRTAGAGQGYEEAQSRQGDGSGGGALVEAESLRITKRVVPEYPVFSRKRKEEGTVSVVITIVRGSVEKAEIERSSGYERLDASALRAARQWRFDTGDTAVLRARVSFSFKLSGN